MMNTTLNTAPKSVLDTDLPTAFGVENTTIDFDTLDKSHIVCIVRDNEHIARVSTDGTGGTSVLLRLATTERLLFQNVINQNMLSMRLTKAITDADETDDLAEIAKTVATNNNVEFKYFKRRG